MGWIRRARALFHRDKLSADLEEELRFHLEMRVQMNANDGLSPEEARSDARRRFGNPTLLRERLRDTDLLTFVESVGHDLRFAVRMLAKHPGFTALAVLALSVGIGVNTAVFTAYKAFLLRPIDAANPRELVNLFHSRPDHAYDPVFSYPDFIGLRNRDRSLSGILAVTGDELAMTGATTSANAVSSFGSSLIAALGFRMPTAISGSAEYVRTAMVSENFFSVLGIGAVRGRVFLNRDAHEIDLHPQVLISANAWQRRFAGDPSILGKSIKLNGVAFTIIGVTPQDFMGTFTTEVPDFWMPLRLEPLVRHASDTLTNPEKPCCTLVGRLAPGVTLAQAQAETEVLANRLRVFHAPGTEGSKPLTIELTPGSPFLQPHQDQKLNLIVLVTLGAVALVLLIACANVAGMQLARSAARQREIGVRLSLGAGRARLIRQLLTESALLGVMAGAISALMAWWTLRLLVVEASSAMPLDWGMFAMHVDPDSAVFAYVFFVSLFASVLFGLAPALESSRPDLTSSLKEEGARFAFRLGNRRLRNLLVGFQVAVCLFLLVVAGLLIHSSIRAVSLETGYEARRVVELDVDFPAAFTYTHAQQIAEVNQFRRNLLAVPGVDHVTVARSPDGGGLRTAKVSGNAPAGRGAGQNAPAMLFYTFVLPDYFDTLGIRLMAGHTFNDAAGENQSGAVISQSAADELWPGQNPIGRTLSLDITDQFHVDSEVMPTKAPYVVVGIAHETRGVLLDGSDSRKVYLPLPASRMDEMPLLVRTASDPAPMIHSLARAMQAVDPDVVIHAITLQSALSGSPQFVVSRCAGLFASVIGLLGLLLAATGIYGSVSYAVVRRTREVGIRMALGAARHDVLHLVLSETSRPVLVGLAAGWVAAIAASYLLRAILNGLSTLDPTAFIGVSLFFLAIALLAAYLPAKRALRVDPMVALRYE